MSQRANKRLDWDGLVKFLVQRARTPSGATGTNLNHAWPPGVIATARRLRDGQTSPMMLTAPDFKSLREKHNADLLDEIVAVQPYVAKTGFMGCGLFETEFQRKGRRCDAQAALSTFELAQWPQEDARRFECFQSAAEVPESCSSSLERRKVDRSAKRVHGVLHRVLAMTTRSIVEHVQREVRGTLRSRVLSKNIPCKLCVTLIAPLLVMLPLRVVKVLYGLMQNRTTTVSTHTRWNILSRPSCQFLYSR